MFNEIFGGLRIILVNLLIGGVPCLIKVFLVEMYDNALDENINFLYIYFPFNLANAIFIFSGFSNIAYAVNVIFDEIAIGFYKNTKKLMKHKVTELMIDKTLKNANLVIGIFVICSTSYRISCGGHFFGKLPNIKPCDHFSLSSITFDSFSFFFE